MGGWAGARLVSRAGWAAEGRGGGTLGRVIGERYDTDATAGVGTVAQDPWYYKAYDGFSRHVATFRGADASPKEIYTHHEMGSGGAGGSQLPIRREVDATGNGGWGGSSDGVLETATYTLHRANGDVIAVVGGSTPGSGSGARPGAVRERMEYVPGGDGAWGVGSVEPMRLSPSDGYQIGGARGADGLVTGDDYNAWIAEYAAGTANGATDLNNNGAVDGDDFTAWNAEWDSGALVGRAIMSVPDGADFKGPGNVRGAMAAAGVALDAVLSGKVSGSKGETGRVRWGGGGIALTATGGLLWTAKNPGIPIPYSPIRWFPSPCETDLSHTDCDFFCRPNRRLFGFVENGPDGRPRRCCICTRNIYRWLERELEPDIHGPPAPGPPFTERPGWIDGFQMVVQCVFVHESVHLNQCGGGRDCNECFAYNAEIDCLIAAGAMCTTDACRKVINRALKDAMQRHADHCERCYSVLPPHLPRDCRSIK